MLHDRAVRALVRRRRRDVLLHVLAAVLALSFLPGHLLLALVGSFAAAIWAARYTWRRTEHGSENGVLALTFGGAHRRRAPSASSSASSAR